jgi:hypothetical protein
VEQSGLRAASLGLLSRCATAVANDSLPCRGHGDRFVVRGSFVLRIFSVYTTHSSRTWSSET